MKGNQEIIDALNGCLSTDLTAIDIYFVQSRMCEDWGLKKAHAAFGHESEHEKNHATRLVDRILFLEGTPVLTARKEYQIGANLAAMIDSNLAFEMEGVAELRAAIGLAEQKQDYATRELLEDLLKDSEEDHVHWLEQQQGLIKRMGEENYLQSMAGEVA